MSSLAFFIDGVRPEPHAAVPTLNFGLRIQDAAGTPVHSILLRCQVQIDTRRRPHGSAEQERLTDLFGTPERWGDTLRPLLWTQSTLVVPAFAGSTSVDLPIPCTYDFEVTSARYLQALEGGEVPLLVLFSGTVFRKAENGFRVEQVPWDRQASYRMPVEVWRRLMDAYFPGGGWIRLRRESLDALQRFRARHGITGWDDAIAALLEEAEVEAKGASK
jgi:hypothetical protein